MKMICVLVEGDVYVYICTVRLIMEDDIDLGKKRKKRKEHLEVCIVFRYTQHIFLRGTGNLIT